MITVEEKIKQLSTLIRECEKFRPVFLPHWDFNIPGSPVSQKEQKKKREEQKKKRPVFQEKKKREEKQKKKREEELLSLRHRLQAAIDRFTTPDDSYRKNLNAAAARDSSGIASMENLLPIAKALCADLQAGWFK